MVSWKSNENFFSPFAIRSNKYITNTLLFSYIQHYNKRNNFIYRRRRPKRFFSSSDKKLLFAIERFCTRTSLSIHVGCIHANNQTRINCFPFERERFHRDAFVPYITATSVKILSSFIANIIIIEIFHLPIPRRHNTSKRRRDDTTKLLKWYLKIY